MSGNQSRPKRTKKDQVPPTTTTKQAKKDSSKIGARALQPPMDETSKPKTLLNTDSTGTEAPNRIFMDYSGPEADNYFESLLECPVCFDVILPPIKGCVQGHHCCTNCRKRLNKCPICRGAFSSVRNLFAEQFLEKCKIKCKNAECPVVLAPQALGEHYKESCEYRPILCRECNKVIPYDMFLDHLQSTDKLDRQQASECSTGFDITLADFITPDSKVIWEPTWMSCYGENFFCCLDRINGFWCIWVASLSPEGRNYSCQIIIWNKNLECQMSFAGEIHSIREDPESVFKSGKCLVLPEHVIKTYLLEDGIDVIVRIEKKYNQPKTRTGKLIQSPLELRIKKPKICNKPTLATVANAVAAVAANISEQVAVAPNQTPTAANYIRELGMNIGQAPAGGIRAVGAAAGALIRSGRALFETRRN